MTCNCGIPSKANLYYFWIQIQPIRDNSGNKIGTETDYINVYRCNDHPLFERDIQDEYDSDSWFGGRWIESWTETELR